MGAGFLAFGVGGTGRSGSVAIDERSWVAFAFAFVSWVPVCSCGLRNLHSFRRGMFHTYQASTVDSNLSSFHVPTAID